MGSKGLGFKILFQILFILLTVILVFSIIRTTFGGSSVTFSSFLDYISNVPQIKITNVNIMHIGGDWLIFDGFRQFLNTIMSIANFGVWFTTQLLNGLSYIFHFVRFLFVV